MVFFIKLFSKIGCNLYVKKTRLDGCWRRKGYFLIDIQLLRVGVHVSYEHQLCSKGNSLFRIYFWNWGKDEGICMITIRTREKSRFFECFCCIYQILLPYLRKKVDKFLKSEEEEFILWLYSHLFAIPSTDHSLLFWIRNKFLSKMSES